VKKPIVTIPPRFLERYRKYHLEIRHLVVLALVLISFQFIVLYMNRNSLHKVLSRSQEWYQQDAAERIANLTATSFEMLLESKSARRDFSENEARQIVQDFNIIFSQPLLEKDVQSLCILIPRGDSVIVIDEGQQLFAYFFGDPARVRTSGENHADAIRMFRQIRDSLRTSEQTLTVVEQQQVFHVFTPFVPHGEFVGAEYMKTSPDLSFLTEEMSSNYDQTGFVYSGLIIIGLIAMFTISSRTLKERNEAQRLLYEEHTSHLSQEIHRQKEMLFTKRIYHAHHKAEKIGGFIKEDLYLLTPDTMATIRNRINKYSSFIARVIYDMKWYDPPIHTIRGPLFDTDLNETLRFIIDNIFRRVTGGAQVVEFVLDLDPRLPHVAINEYVVWEAVEPIIQNCIDHANVGRNVVTIRTTNDPERRVSSIVITDVGRGVRPDLLEPDAQGMKKIFLEHLTTGGGEGKEHTGYGCYIAYELATQRFGWKLDVVNRPEGGAQFTFVIPN
jgi:hypothetical protein